MDYFNIRKVFLPINLAFDDPEVKKLDAFVLLLKKSGIGKLIKKTYKTGNPDIKQIVYLQLYFMDSLFIRSP